VLTREQRKELVRRCTNPLSSEGVHAPSAWFNFLPVSSVNRDNFVEWLYWAIFSSTVEDGEEFLSEVEEYLTDMEQREGVKLIPGHDPKIKPIRVTLDPVRTTHRPLIWYLVSICPRITRNVTVLTIHLEACRFCRYMLFLGPPCSQFQTSQHGRHFSRFPSPAIHSTFQLFARPSAVLVPPPSFRDKVPRFVPTWHRGTFDASVT